MFLRFTRAVFSNSVYFVIGSLSFLVITPLALKSLGAETYGFWVILIGVMQFAGLANLSLNTTMERYVARFSVLQQQDPHRAELGLSVAMTFSYLFMFLIGLVVTFGLWMFKDAIASLLSPSASQAHLISTALGLMSLGLPFLFLSQVSKGILYGLIQNKLAGGIDLLLTQTLWIGVIFISRNAGPALFYAAFWSLIVNSAGFLIYTFFGLNCLHRLNLKWRPGFELKLATELFDYSFFNWLTSLGILLFQSMDRLLVGVLIGPVAAGAYSIASSVALRVNMLAGQFTQALSPAASSFQAAERPQGIRILFVNVSKITSWVLVLSGSLLVIWMDQILRYWISPSFSAQYAQVFRLMVIAYACFSLSRAAHQTLTGMGLVKVTALLTVSGAILVLLMIYLLTPAYGILGAVAGNFSYMVVLLMNLYLALHLEKGTAPEIARGILSTIGLLFLVLFLTSVDASPAYRVVLSVCITSMVIFHLLPFIRKFAWRQSFRPEIGALRKA